MTRNSLDNPIILFFILVMIVSINIIASVHFLLITFSGILFIAFFTCLKKRYLYSLFFVVLAFLCIEMNTGLKPFSLSILSLFIYVFIIPSSDNTHSYEIANSYLYMIFFYIGVLLLWMFYFQLDEKILIALLINLIIDFIFFGALI